MVIPTTEPRSVRAGDTVAWTRDLADYPASDGWVLHYRLVYPDNSTPASWTSTGSGTVHAVSLSAVTTATFPVGEGTLFAYVERSLGGATERVSLGTQQITVLANLTSTNTIDGRTSAQRILADLRAALETYLSGSNATIAEYAIGDRVMKFRSTSDILDLIRYYEAVVRDETNCAACAIKPRVLYRG